MEKKINRDDLVTNKSNHFNPLTPTDNAEGCEIYIESLEWALENKKKIKNIAISGPFGSGKSSILQTFIKKCESSNFRKLIKDFPKTIFFKNLWHFFCPKYRFFKISLATFKDIQINTQDKDKNNIDLQRLIELSILQQLFFHEKESQIPDSRFKKIKRHKNTKLFIYSLGIIIYLISILYLFKPEILEKIISFKFSENLNKFTLYIASIITFLGLFCIIYKFSRSFIGLSIKKLNIKTADIEIDKEISKSILNNHIDEIIYFFEATKYNVVIIEDLDRFEQTEVFTKLREINLLINNSKKVKREIVFIYAIKDDMFLDKDRAKFFDFIIPIIPVINFSNSGDKLRKIIKENNYSINDELLDDLSIFIDDMRILYNILNEFYIYSNIVSNNLERDKLLSIIVYKNIFPYDFSLLTEKKGELYNTIIKKSEYIKIAIENIEKQIAKLKEEIKEIEEHSIKNIKDIRILYVAKIVEKICSNSEFYGFKIKDNLIKITDLSNDENFTHIFNNSIDYYYNHNYNYNYVKTFAFNFSEIEKEINPTYTYKEREEMILNKNKINNLKKEIEKLNEQKNQIQKSKLKDLLSNDKITFKLDSNPKYELITVLLRNGYIDENYLDYISFFHEGALTKPDYQFLIKVKTEQSTIFDYKLNKSAELIKKINEFAFEKRYILNFDLVDEILKSKPNDKKKQNLLNQLSNEEAYSIDFIDQFLYKTKNIELFIEELCKNWHNIWNQVYTKNIFSDERKEEYFKLIIEHAEVKDIFEIFRNSKEYLNNYSNFLNIQLKNDKLEQIIKILDLKFNSIEIDSPEDKLNYIYENHNYAINIEMIKTLISTKNVYTDEFNTANYSFIISTKLQPMIDYIETYIHQYIDSVFLKLDNNTEEKNENYLHLLNREDLIIDLKENIIIKTNTIVENYDDLEDDNIANLLFKYNKIKPTWKNIIKSFETEDNKFNNDVIAFLNNISNAEILSKIKISDKENVEVTETSKDFSLAIIHNTNLNIEAYRFLTMSIPWWYEEFEAKNLTKEKVNILIDNNRVNPTIDSYNYLRENFKETNIYLLEQYFDNFKENLKELKIDSKDLNLILKSEYINLKNKFDFVNYIDDTTILENNENPELIASYLIDYNSIEVRDSLKIELIKNKNVLVATKIKLFNKNISIINNNIDDFLISLGGKYEQIVNTTIKATLENNTLNQKLLENLVKLDYISSISKVEKGLRVNHKRNEDY